MESIKKRTIEVDNMVCDGCEQKIKDVISKICGVKQVNADYKKGKVKVIYNLSQTELKSIEEKIKEIGYNIKDNFLTKLERSFIHFCEENEKSNLNQKSSPCCSNPEEILKKAGKK